MRFFRRRRKKLEAEVPAPKKDLQTLIKEYRGGKALLSIAAQVYMGHVPEHYLERLERIEEKIIEYLPSDFQKGVFRIFVRHEFDITDFIEKENWKEVLQEVCCDICHFLYWGTPYKGKPAWDPLPFPGNEFFFWLLGQARFGHGEDSVVNILFATEDAIKNREILGHELDKEGVLASGIATRLVVIFLGEYAKQSRVLIDIFWELEGGKSFVRELLGLDAKQSSSS
ncbi:hypothetical protein ACFL11_00490 [Patescibacteria group bacterium]